MTPEGNQMTTVSAAGGDDRRDLVDSRGRQHVRRTGTVSWTHETICGGGVGQSRLNLAADERSFSTKNVLSHHGARQMRPCRLHDRRRGAARA
jgi:hypothetical protein